ncbi:Fe(2+) transporter permease subunit FeoB [Methyloligella sp. 2.7D]|uniref:Fe(2+) transporter permease subunit FeoB n=1 Tax=unclassified Methyloligella TaxID=2625955 RepID=UPI00157DD356|nr:Fe(2+) transporter permease subunit FeoB [Methyloligella sp. GL2]QKP78114.1 Fe(2+) transporter permease subunit FeoB [Methyloligella sp. GL2]
MTETSIAIVGNPNCGKTTLFNALTGTQQRVGNWPGVTVEKKVGTFPYRGQQIEVVDLPGVYSLDGAAGTVSLDEQIARDYVASSDSRLVVNIVDASNIERNLYLTSQLLEMGVRLVVALNMVDIAKSRHIDIDIDALSKRLGCPVVPIVASAEKGIEALKAEIIHAAREQASAHAAIVYNPEIEAAIAEVMPHIAEAATGGSPRWLAIKLLEGDEIAADHVDEKAAALAAKHSETLEETLGADVDTLIASGRYDFVNGVTSSTVRRTTELKKTVSDKLDRIVLNRMLGIPIFLLVMYAMFMFTINIAGAFIDFFDIAAATLFVDGFGHVLESIGTPDWLVTLLATGVGGGIQTVATFVPVIAGLFLFLSILEDSGYMARAAFVMDRLMRMIGLPGKSFVPLIVGFGCNVPAIMAARTLENQRDRTMTVMMAPFMSCGARLPVYALFAAAFFPVGGQNLVFALYLIGIFAAILTGLILKHTLLRGETSPFVMELPPYHIPTLKGILLRTWDRLRSFVLRAGKVIVGMVVVIAFLNSWGADGSFGNEDTENSVLSEIGRGLVPLFEPMGIKEDNWPATVGVFTGILAKETVVGTLNTLYGSMAADAEPGSDEGDEAFDFWGGIGAAFASIGPNLRDAFGMAPDPLGLDVGDIDSPSLAAEEQGVSVGIFGSMASLFDGKVGAFAYLLMVLLYMPCAAAIAAVYRETGRGWAIFISLWTTLLGYSAAVLFYQAATFARHPAYSAWWIGGLIALFAAVVLGMWYYGKHNEHSRPVIIPGV